MCQRGQHCALQIEKLHTGLRLPATFAGALTPHSRRIRSVDSLVCALLVRGGDTPVAGDDRHQSVVLANVEIIPWSSHQSKRDALMRVAPATSVSPLSLKEDFTETVSRYAMRTSTTEERRWQIWKVTQTN